MVTASFTAEASKNVGAHASSRSLQEGTSAATSAHRMAVYAALGSLAAAAGVGTWGITALTALSEMMSRIHFDQMSVWCAKAAAHVWAAREKLPPSMSWPTYLRAKGRGEKG